MSAKPEERAVTITVELEPDVAAALARLCNKFHYNDADQYLYAHVAKAIRSEQSYQMVRALSVLEEALFEAHVRAWPWVETGSAQ